MAIETKCQTDGAVYNIEISSSEINISVKVPFELELTEDEAKLLESNIHNVLELVLSKYFTEKSETSNKIDRFNDYKS